MQGLILHWRNPREVIGFLLPIVAITSMLFGLVIAVLPLLSDSLSREWKGLLLIGSGLLFLPVPFVVLSRRVPLKMFLKCCFILAVYFGARTVGVFYPFGRVERTV